MIKLFATVAIYLPRTIIFVVVKPRQRVAKLLFFGFACPVYERTFDEASFLKISWETRKKELSFEPRLDLISFDGRENEQERCAKNLRKFDENDAENERKI